MPSNSKKKTAAEEDYSSEEEEEPWDEEEEDTEEEPWEEEDTEEEEDPVMSPELKKKKMKIRQEEEEKKVDVSNLPLKKRLTRDFTNKPHHQHQELSSHFNKNNLKPKIALNKNKKLEESDQNNNHQVMYNIKTKQKRSAVAAKEMPERMREMIGLEKKGNNIKLVTRMRFFYSDENYRLSIPIEGIRSEFLTKGEKVLLDRKDEFLNVRLYEPSRKSSVMSLVKWRNVIINGDDDDDDDEMKKYYYLYSSLGRKWDKVRVANDLKEGDEIQLWSFRILEQLGLALVKVGRS